MAQRQFRSDDTSTWLDRYGTGSDGAYSSAGNATDAPIDSTCSGTAGTTSLTATNASFAANQLILIHQTRGTGVTNWELNKIQSYTAGTITTAYSLINTYTDSGASQAQVLVMKQYTTFTQNTGHTLTGKAWNQDVGGIIAIFASVSATITGTLKVSGGAASGASYGSGGGFRGGYRGNCGEGTVGDTYGTSSANGNGGGAGRTDGGANGGNGVQGAGSSPWGDGGLAVGNAALTLMSFGGGGGGNKGGGYDYAGGGGGGIVIIISPSITVTGSITTVGGNGAWMRAGDFGGGGAGGSILMKCFTATLGTGLVTSAGNGNGATGTADGRIHLDYGVSYTGTTTPALDATNDPSIATYSVNVSDSQTTTDLVGYYPNTVWTAELVQMMQVYLINVADSIAVLDRAGYPDDSQFIDEYVNVQIVSPVTDLSVNVADSTTIVDTGSAYFGLGINTSDATTALDVITALTPRMYLSVSDSTTITESANASLNPKLISVSDSTTIVDVPTVLEPILYISVFDPPLSYLLNEDGTYVLQENGDRIILDSPFPMEYVPEPTRDVYNLEVSDHTDIRDIPNGYRSYEEINVLDTTRPREAITIFTDPLVLSVSDSTTTVDTVDVLLPYYSVSVSDSQTVNEATSFTGVIYLTISDSETVNDTATAQVQKAADINISVTDSTIVNDSLIIFVANAEDLNIVVTDHTHVTDVLINILRISKATGYKYMPTRHSRRMR